MTEPLIDESQWADDYAHDQDHELDWLGRTIHKHTVCGLTITSYIDKRDGRTLFHIDHNSYGTEAEAVLHAALMAAGGDINTTMRLVPVLIGGIGGRDHDPR